MGLVEADLGSWCACEIVPTLVSHAPLEDRPLATHREPSACTAGSSRSFNAIRKEAGLFRGTFLQKGEVLAHVVLFQNLKDLKNRISRPSHRLQKPLPTKTTELFFLTKTPFPWLGMNPKNRKSLRPNRINNQAQYQILNHPTHDQTHTRGNAAINAGPLTSTSLRPDAVCLTQST